MDDPNERIGSDFNPADDLKDISGPAKIALVAVLALVVLLTAGCSSVGPVEQVQRIPPAAAMVKMQPLPEQTDATMGGLYRGYVGAAQEYRACTRNLEELQEFVRSE